MVDYGRIRNTVRPEEKVVDEYSVWMNTDIQEVEVTTEGDTHIEYEFNQVQYSKDEFIELVSEQNKELTGLMNTMLGVNEVQPTKTYVAQQTNRFFQIMAQQMNLDDETAMEIADLYEPWEVGKAYEVGKIVKYGVNADGETQLYTIIQAHTSQADWTPDITTALFKAIGFNSGIPIWTQPLGATDAYMKGDVVSHNGKTWESNVDNNVWEPGVYGWTETTT